MSTFNQFIPAGTANSDVLVGASSEVTLGLWPGGTGSLAEIYSASSATASITNQYYMDAYDLPLTDDKSEICFAVAYGHRTGGGHPTLTQVDTSTLATQAVYSQYRNLLLDAGDSQFTFYGAYNSDHIYVINIYRYLMKERLDAGNWMLSLKGNNGTFTFIDDSGQAMGSAFGKAGQVFYVLSGSIGGNITTGATIHSSASVSKGGYGMFYPSLGVIVLNPDAISQTVGFPSGSYAKADGSILSGSTWWAPYTGSTFTASYNHVALFNSINQGDDFQARSAENISSTHYFVRLRAAEFNYSNNPTFFDAVTGKPIYSTFQLDPKVYVTTIGLYNDGNELLAVAKLSKPIQKGFDKEINLRVRLDF